MRMKLERVRPPTIGQTLRIPGITHGRSNLYPRGIRLQGARRPAD
jgi:tRNA U34 5-carboxymethylaminomethyl modifying enzyme MnmG/GidA